MIIREIEEKDNKIVEQIIRTCLIEFGGNRDGLAWSDPNLGEFYKVYAVDNSVYYVIEDNNKVIGGCGIGPLIDDICELQKMYILKEYRGKKISHDLMNKCLEFAKEHYRICYIETLSNMIAANKFYKKYGFEELDEPLIKTEHFACDKWYKKEL